MPAEAIGVKLGISHQNMKLCIHRYCLGVCGSDFYIWLL